MKWPREMLEKNPLFGIFGILKLIYIYAAIFMLLFISYNIANCHAGLVDIDQLWYSLAK